MNQSRRRSSFRLGLAVMAVLSLAACGTATSSPSPTGAPSGSPTTSPAPTDPPSAAPSEGAGEGNNVGALDGTGWRVLRIDDAAPVSGSEPTLAFKGGRIEGHTGCNSYGGPVTIQGSSFTAGDIAMTLIGCMDEIGTMETAFLHAIDQATELGAEGANLVIRGPGGEILLRPDASVR